MYRDGVKNAMDCFALPSPRVSQKLVIEEIEKVFRSGKKVVLLEAPVGSGKSAIAMTFSNAFSNSHVLTPRKTLQDQYYSDFKQSIVTMKGRRSYPCLADVDTRIPSQKRWALSIVEQVSDGRVMPPERGQLNCAIGPCRGNTSEYRECTTRLKSDKLNCPYTIAVDTAVANETIVHNLHSFIFQTMYAERFKKRDVIIIDEAHEVEGMIREFATKTIKLPMKQLKDAPPGMSDTECSAEDWANFLMGPNYAPKKPYIPEGVDPTPRAAAELEIWTQYSNAVESIKQIKGPFVVKIIPPFRAGDLEIQFVPVYLGGLTKQLLLDYGEYVIMMSGTIYDKEMFCKNLNINPDEVHFIRMGSSFPKENRPIYIRPDLQIDTSFANWNEGFPEILNLINSICGKFPDVKGLIHAPSYKAADELIAGLKNKRIVTHTKDNFQKELEAFYNSKEPDIFLSPICQQGVDFKDDRGRFQIIIRLPYPNTSDPLVAYQFKNNFSWVNYQALVVLGQQLGRINRSDTDWGYSFILDSRVNTFLTKNSSKIPQWVKDSFIRTK